VAPATTRVVSSPQAPGPPTTPRLVMGSSSRSKTSCSAARERSKSSMSRPARSMTSATRSRTWVAVSGFHSRNLASNFSAKASTAASLFFCPSFVRAPARLPRPATPRTSGAHAGPATSEARDLAGGTTTIRPCDGILNPSASGRSNTAQVPTRGLRDRVERRMSTGRACHCKLMPDGPSSGWRVNRLGPVPIEGLFTAAYARRWSGATNG